MTFARVGNLIHNLKHYCDDCFSFEVSFFFLGIIFNLQKTASPSLISKIFLISSGIVIRPPAVTSAKNGMSSSTTSVGM